MVIKYLNIQSYQIWNQQNWVTGNNEINFKIKKIKQFIKSRKWNKIDIYLQNTKSKFVKEKDSKNEVSKYQIDIVAKLEVTSISNKNILNFSIKKTNDFIVDAKQSKTYEKEKKINDLLIDETLDEIVDKLLLELNDI